MDKEQIKKFKQVLALKTITPKVRTQEEILAKTAETNEKEKPKYKKKPKPLTKEEKEQIELNAMINYEAGTAKMAEEILTPEKESDEWDVKIGDPITYFDPNLSYELTGYRPITKDKGLDFNPKLFTVAADNYRKNGRYTSYTPGTFIHRNYWLEEFKKCHDGVTIGRYRLTGENYFFLNYYRLLSVLGDKKGGELREENFPTFIAK